jgi:hypothetical protein
MNSYRVAATGENRAKPTDKAFHVEVTVEGYDDMDAKQKAIIYLNRIYDSCIWRADSVNQLVAKRKPTRRKPKPITKRRHS